MNELEIAEYWDNLELEERIDLLRRVGTKDFSRSAALCFNWIAINKHMKGKLRPKIQEAHGSNRHSNLPDNAVCNLVAGTQVQKPGRKDQALAPEPIRGKAYGDTVQQRIPGGIIDADEKRISRRGSS